MKNLMLVTAALLAGSVLTGCGAGTSAAPASVVVHGGTIAGKAMGGQQPVANASVQLWAAGSSGYGAASTALITGLAATTSNGSGVVGTTGNASNANNTLAAGSFTITGDFTCPTLTPATPVYMTITGGNPVGTATNANLGLMAALGPCNGLTSGTFINVNEITTVGSVWALSGFMTAYDHVGTSSSNVLGLANAFATANKLVDTSTGLPIGPALPAGATVPDQEIYALANILATCVNSAGSTGLSDTTSNCGKLFTLTTVGSEPANTIDAALSIAQNPTNNVAGLFGQINAIGAAFSTSEAQPTSWTIAINYTGGGLNNPKGIAVDGSGNVWVPNAGNSSVFRLAPSATSIAAATAITSITDAHINQPSALAVDGSGNAWITNTGNSTITEIGPSGTVGSTFSGNGLSTPSGIAFDAAGSIWVSNSGANSVSAFTGAGTAIGTYSNVAGLATPVGIAADPQ
ncbi:MAG TPA: NHL repeat-containing protein [Terriglobales bacterium]|jgi:hypothetical protein